MKFSTRRLNASWGRPNEQLCNRLSITRSTQYHIRAASGQCCPNVRTVACKYHNKDRIQMVLPWRSDGCNSSLYLALSMITSERCCPIIRTDATVFPYLCLWGKFNFLLNFDERLDMLPWRSDGCNHELFETSKHWWVSIRMTGPSRRKLEIQLL
jgi:hypothetical protein